MESQLREVVPVSSAKLASQLPANLNTVVFSEFKYNK